jgi:hypothetical protein
MIGYPEPGLASNMPESKALRPIFARFYTMNIGHCKKPAIVRPMILTTQRLWFGSDDEWEPADGGLKHLKCHTLKEPGAQERSLKSTHN